MFMSPVPLIASSKIIDFPAAAFMPIVPLDSTAFDLPFSALFENEISLSSAIKYNSARLNIAPPPDVAVLDVN